MKVVVQDLPPKPQPQLHSTIPPHAKHAQPSFSLAFSSLRQRVAYKKAKHLR